MHNLFDSCEENKCCQSFTPYTKRCLKEEVGARGGEEFVWSLQGGAYAGWLGPALRVSSASCRWQGYSVSPPSASYWDMQALKSDKSEYPPLTICNKQIAITILYFRVLNNISWLV